MPLSAIDMMHSFAGRLNISSVLGILAIILAAFILVRAGSTAITKLLNKDKKSAITGSKRAQTMGALFKSILRYSVYFMAGVMILGLLGVQTGALLTGAGVIGLAVGFGAKNLVEDVITGFFILFEDQYAVGDHISASGLSGIVQEVGLRVTRLKDLGGQVHYIPNGKIAQVTNYSRGSLQVVVDIGVAYEEDLNRVTNVLEQAGRILLQEQPDLITEGPEVLGLVSLHPGQSTIRVSAGARPLQQGKVEREMRKRFKEALDNAGIKPGKM
ncbi:MAG: putative MscS family protein YkuT [Pelotomaculum sp. PtaU1.Bin035]|nr:MAG: putative MscS family protein YkuT [Pelotomaculum sp. PtaU1.Bin035]